MPEAAPSRPTLVPFLALAAGQAVSSLGTLLTTFALQWTVWSQLQSGTAQALLWIFSALPVILLGPVAGALVDRLDRRRTVLLADLASGLVVLAGAFALRGDGLSLPLVYGTVAAVTCAKLFMGPALGALVPQLVPEAHLARANSAFEFLQGAGMIAAPVLAGLLLGAGWSVPQILVLDGASYGVAALLLALVRGRDNGAGAAPAPPRPDRKRSLAEDLAGGLRYLRGRPTLLWMLGLFAVINLLGSGLQVALPQLVTHKFGAGPQLLGTFEAAMGIGVLAGSGLLALWGGPKRRVAGILGALALASVFQAGIGLAPAPRLATGALGAAVAGWLVANTLQTTLLQESVDGALLGRVLALRRSLEQVTYPVSSMLTGLLAPALLRADHLFALSGVLSVGAVLLVARLHVAISRGTAANGFHPTLHA